MQGMIFLTKSLYMVQSDCCPCFLGRSGLRRDIVAGLLLAVWRKALYGLIS